MADYHAFHVLLPEHVACLRRRALKLTSNDHRADDLVQATLLKAWANRDRYSPDTNLRAWLFTIMRNTFFSDLRKYRHEIEDVDGTYAAALSEEPAQDHALALKEMIAAIALLPAAQRRPLVLMGVYGFSQLEAAEACHCSVGTIKSRVSRSRAALAQSLAHDAVALGPQKPPAGPGKTLGGRATNGRIRPWERPTADNGAGRGPFPG